MNTKKTVDEKAIEHANKVSDPEWDCFHKREISFKIGHADGVKEGYLMAVKELRNIGKDSSTICSDELVEVAHKSAFVDGIFIAGMDWAFIHGAGWMQKTISNKTQDFLEAKGKEKGVL